MATLISGLPEKKETCTVKFTNCDKTVTCKPHTNLRQLAIENDIELYNGPAKYFNCQGMGLCGTCTVEIVPQEAVTTRGARENLRLLRPKGNLRLACQVNVVDDLMVTKHPGLHGTRGYKVALPQEEMVRLYREGKTMAEVAAQFKCPVGQVAAVFDRAGVEVRKPGSVA